MNWKTPTIHRKTITHEYTTTTTTTTTPTSTITPLPPFLAVTLRTTPITIQDSKRTRLAKGVSAQRLEITLVGLDTGPY